MPVDVRHPVPEIQLLIGLRLIFAAGKMPAKKERKDLGILGVLFFFGFLIYVLTDYIVPGFLWGILPSAFLYFLILVPPLVFLGFRLKQASWGAAHNGTGDKARHFANHYQLTPRELEILVLVLQGKTNNEIEDTLFIAKQTIKNNLSRIYKKTGIPNRVKLMKRFDDFSPT